MTVLRKTALLAATFAALTALTFAAPPAVATHADRPIVLPGATGTEGIASGAGSTFDAGDLLTGDIFRGDVLKGTAAKFIDAPTGRFAAGMKADIGDGLLLVAGGATGQGYVYSTATGAPLASYTFAGAPTFINDVALTDAGAWFTDSARAVLYFVPVTAGVPGSYTTLHLSGPAADPRSLWSAPELFASTQGRSKHVGPERLSDEAIALLEMLVDPAATFASLPDRATPTTSRSLSGRARPQAPHLVAQLTSPAPKAEDAP